jgi:hypothetical protein
MLDNHGVKRVLEQLCTLAMEDLMTTTLMNATIVPPSPFGKIWQAAVVAYESDTGRKVMSSDELFDCVSVDDVAGVMQKRGNAFEAFREDGQKIRSWLEPVVRFVNLFLESGAEAAAAYVRLSCDYSAPLG